MEIFIDYMQYLNPGLYLDRRDIWIKGIRLMPDRGGVPDPDYLYFSGDREPPAIAGGPVYVLLATEDGLERPVYHDCVVLHTDMGLAEIFNEMLGLQNLLLGWIQEIELSVGRDEGIQKLIDISFRAFGNPIVVISPAMKTIAGTRDMVTGDQIFDELLGIGYLTQESFNRLRDNNYFNTAYYDGRTHIMPPSSIKDYTSTLTAFLKDNMVGYLALMFCGNAPLTRGMLQMYEYFLNKAAAYLQPGDNSDILRESQLEYFLVDIIEGRVTTPREIVERTLISPPPYGSDYRTIVVRLQNGTDMYLAHAIATTKTIYPDLIQMLYKDSFIIYFDMNSKKYQWQDFLAGFNSYLTKAEALAGVSEVFHGLETIQESYRQALDALTVGMELRDRPVSGGMPERRELRRVFLFKDWHVFMMLSRTETRTAVLDRIAAWDAANNTAYYRILYVFLCMERNYTQAAAALHMHRNNVIYHMGRICKFFQLDLEDPEQRLRLLMMYKLRDMSPGPSGQGAAAP